MLASTRVCGGCNFLRASNAHPYGFKLCLQHNTVFENRNLAEALLLGAGLLAGGNVQHQLVQVGTGLIQRALAVSHNARIEVDPRLFSWRPAGCWWQSSAWGGRAERRAAARAEQHHMGTGGGQCGGADKVIAGAVESIFRPLVTTGSP